MNKDDKTIKQLADEIGVSKQALYKRITRDPLHKELHMYMYTKGTTKYIDVHGQDLIKSVLKVDSHVQKPNTYTNTDTHTSIHSDAIGIQSIIDLLSKQLEEKDNQILMLNDRIAEHSKSNENQLETKDNQITELNKRLAESQELNRNQQVLLKHEQERLLLIENQTEESFFEKIFKKRKVTRIK